MARRRVPGVRRRPGPAHLLLSRPWLRAPLAALSQPGASMAVLVATAVLGIAAATSPLFLSSAATGALHRVVSTCPEVYRPAITNQSADEPDFPLEQPAAKYAATEDAAVRGLLSSRGVPVQQRVLVLTGGAGGGVLTAGRTGRTIEAITAYSAPDALAHVVVQRGTPGTAGLWLPDRLADRLGAGPGDQVTVRNRPVPVAGVYRGLDDPGFEGDLPQAWCRWAGLILPTAGDGIGAATVHPLVLADPATLLALAGRDRAQASWLVDIDPATARAGDAAAVAARVHGSADDLFGDSQLIGQYVEQNPLADAATRAAQVRSALAGATRPAALAAVLIALALVAAAGGYWAERRADEVRLLAARGVGPPGLGGKAVLEMLGPALAGGLLGWAVTLLAAPRLGPSSLLDAGAGPDSLRTVAVALVVGLLALGAVAGVRGRATGERAVGLAGSRWGFVPWELLLVGAAVVAYGNLRAGGAVSGGEAVRVSPGIVALPLLALTGLTVFVVRLLVLPVPRLRGPADRLPVPGFLAARRLAAARTVSAAALVAVALPVGLLVTCASLAASSAETVHAKTATYVGAEVALRTDAAPGATPAAGGHGTVVSTFDEGLATDGTGLPVLAVDPATFVRYAYWRDEFAGVPLPELLARLGPPRDGRLPAILAGTGRDYGQVGLRSTTVPVRIVGRARAFPGMRSVAAPMLVVARGALPRIDPYTDRSEEVWTSAADAGAAAAAIGHGGMRVTGRVTEDAIVRNTDLYPLTWTFGYVEVLAGLAGVIGVCALLLYLAARQRSRTAAYALSRRMGLTRRAHLTSLLLELGVAVGTGALTGVLLARAVLDPVVRVLQLEPGRPPYRSQLVLSAPAVVAVLVAAVLLVLFGALATQAVADRTRAADVLRGAQ
jgi:putative ABC transport system permease protein